jgi:hypothetical protein
MSTNNPKATTSPENRGTIAYHSTNVVGVDIQSPDANAVLYATNHPSLVRGGIENLRTKICGLAAWKAAITDDNEYASNAWK